jgi:hypothetical protein
MGEFWLNAFIRTVPEKNEVLKRHGEELKATNRKDAIKEAMTRIKTLNEEERNKKTNKRYQINFVMEVYREMYLKDRNYWIDEQSFRELYPDQEYPK